MGKRYLIDTNILIAYSGKILPEKAHCFVSEIIDIEFNISIINKIEVLGHNTSGTDIEDFIDLATVFDLNKMVVDKTILLRKDYRIKLPDTIIAATCLVYKFTLITRNIKDFKNIDDLDILNPYEL